MQNNNYTKLATQEQITNTQKNLKSHNMNSVVAEKGSETIKIIEDLIPKNAEVMTATSTTLDQIGLTQIINESGQYNSIKEKLTKMDRATDGLTMQKLGAGPEYVIGSVHAVTEDGKVVIASGSGSQLPAYSYGAPHVIWIVSTKKIVKNLDIALDRIYSHVLPLEDRRMKGVYGPESGSNVNKLLIINHELNPERITIVFVKEDLGF